MAAAASDSVDWLPAVITGFFTLAAGLSSVFLTLWFSRRVAREDRADQRTHEHRLEQRFAIADLLDTGGRWTSTQESLMLAAAVITDPVALTSLDTWDSHAQAKEAYRKALVRARLVVSDPPLAGKVRELSAGLDSVSKFFEPILQTAQESGRATPEAVEGGLSFVDTQQARLQELEHLALDRLTA